MVTVEQSESEEKYVELSLRLLRQAQAERDKGWGVVAHAMTEFEGVKGP